MMCIVTCLCLDIDPFGNFLSWLVFVVSFDFVMFLLHCQCSLYHLDCGSAIAGHCFISNMHGLTFVIVFIQIPFLFQSWFMIECSFCLLRIHVCRNEYNGLCFGRADLLLVFCFQVIKKGNTNTKRKNNSK